MFKKMLCVIMVACFMMTTGCATIGGGSANTNTTEMQRQAILMGIELTGYNLGYYVGKSKTDLDDIALADAFSLIQNGTLSPKQVAEAFKKFKLEQPQLAGSLAIVLERMGATFDVGGGLISISNIPLEYWNTAAKGYATGFEFGKAGQKGIVESAVKKLLPKKKI